MIWLHILNLVGAVLAVMFWARHSWPNVIAIALFTIAAICNAVFVIDGLLTPLLIVRGATP
ncbi:MAG: hypothetical protein EA385_15275 [Salinarimonadaceae bacterium]|nr:MAG: hypothetical protein EA385_15275 [Salinarimonadaceae bacterium]